MLTLTQQIVTLHDALRAAKVPHAFGGALALAWCTQRARGTIDIDINLFIEPDRFEAAFDAFPTGVIATEANIAEIGRDGQTRLWWDSTPVDVFCNTTGYHATIAERVRLEHFGGSTIPFLSCADVAVFKVFFNRTKDWADLEEMAAAGCLDVIRVTGVLAIYLGPTDERIVRLLQLSHGA